ncbi:MAG TPA: sugar ABC transporter permease [Symbiobacteriaceae bacterium]|nr:sugar ABC transporter permease [Symbiobacteriaceae bacterium]
MRRPINRRQVQQNLWGLFFCAPWILHFSLLVLFPMAASFVFSLYDFGGLFGMGPFVGLGNYKELIFQDERFARTVANTLSIGLMMVIPGLILAIGLGALLTGKFPGKNIFRLIVYTPSVIPPVVIAIVWQQMLNSRFGIINIFLGKLGLPEPPWLGDPMWAKWAIAIISWYTIGGSVLAFAAAFEEVPRELVESALIDGAGALRRFWSVELPMVTPQVFFFVVQGIIALLGGIVVPFVVTGGGPAEATLVWPLYMYRLMFNYNKFGHGAATAWIMATVVVLLLLAVFRSSKRWVYYEGGDQK